MATDSTVDTFLAKYNDYKIKAIYIYIYIYILTLLMCILSIGHLP